MREHPINRAAKTMINFDYKGSHYAIPVREAEKYKVKNGAKDTLTVREVFADLIGEYGEAGTLLRGLRAKEGLTQIAFAKKLGLTQANLSAMENGRRPIGKTIAKRIEKIFGVNYRFFLE